MYYGVDDFCYDSLLRSRGREHRKLGTQITIFIGFDLPRILPGKSRNADIEKAEMK